MDKSQLLTQKIRYIELTTNKIVDSLFCGLYASIFKGRGLELEELREFQEGDDVRAVSWAKTAQMGKPYVKTFREERDLQVMLLVDVSKSMDMGSHYEQKKERVAELGAILALSAIKNHDRVGLILFSDHIEKCIMPKRGTRHGTRLIRELLCYEPTSKKTNLQLPLEYYDRLSAKRSICFIISDFEGTSIHKDLLIVSKKNDVIGIRVYDPIETSIPPLGVTRIKDIETDVEMYIDINEQVVRQYHSASIEGFESVKRVFAQSGADLIDISTKKSFVDALKAYFARRKKYRK